jgi:hypothetical protein
MDESALRTLLNSLEACRSSLHRLLHVFTWFVVVGLGFDLFVIIKEFRDDWKEFRYGQIHRYDIHLPERPSISLVVLGLLGTALIVFGVAGELYVDVKAGKIETQIREANDNLLSLIIQEAGDAKTSAESAKASAKVVGEQAAILEATTKRLIWEGPRDILLSDAEESFKPLRKFSGQKFRFSVCLADFNSGAMIASLGVTEVGRTEQAIFTQLRQAGWKPLATQTSLPYISNTCVSVSVSVNPSKDATRSSRNAADALQSVLNQVLSDDNPVGGVGGWGRLMSSPDPGPEIIDIHVGAHPVQPAVKKHK